MSLTVVIPCYNESAEVLHSTLVSVLGALKEIPGEGHEVVVINDGSTRHTYERIADLPVKLIEHPENRGYGASLMSGIEASRNEWIAILDSDGTYPIGQLPEMARYTRTHDMVLGKRPWSQISWLRRPAKYTLHRFASFMAGKDVLDLNTGMRIFKKATVLKYRTLFPQRFSFTSTLTMIAMTGGQRVKAVDIQYGKRIGKSKIRPIHDTIAFFSLVLRLSLYFNPLKVFMPTSFLLLSLAVARGIRDYNVVGYLGGLCLVLFFMAFQVFFFGLVAEILNRRLQ